MPLIRTHRVVLATTTEHPQGGIATLLSELAHSLAAPGWEVTAGWEQRQHPEDRILSAPAGRVSSMLWPGLVLFQVIRRAAWFARMRPTVVNIHSADPARTAACLLSARLAFRRRCYVSWHASGSPLRGSWIVRALISRLATGYILLSDDAVRAAGAAGADRLKVFLVPPGMPFPRSSSLTREAARKELGLAAETFVVLAAARLVATKGVDDLIRAAADLPCTTVLIAGEGPEKSKLEQLAASVAPGKVRFTGWLSPSQLEAAYQAADVFSLPSRREAFALVYVEAARGGLPSVAYDVDGVRCAVRQGETGILVQPGDVRALAGALRKLLEQPEVRRSMGAAARRRFQTEFTLDRMITDYRAILGPAGHSG
jgi:glycosyltransferase involved in cell wall biosynthesis